MIKGLHGSEILIVEDEALIALDIAVAFEKAGAIVLNAEVCRGSRAIDRA